MSISDPFSKKYDDLHWGWTVCPSLGEYILGKTVEECKLMCIYEKECTAINVFIPDDGTDGENKCRLKKCPFPVPEPDDTKPYHKGTYRIFGYSI